MALPDPTRHTAQIAWHDAHELLAHLHEIDGLAYLRQVVDGTLPIDALAEALGFRLVEVDHGRTVIEGASAPQHGNIAGMLHGGYVTALLDSATGLAMLSTLPAGVAPPHVQLSVSFLESERAGATVRCEAVVERAGRRIGFVRAALRDTGGRLLATATSTHAVVGHAHWERTRPSS